MRQTRQDSLPGILLDPGRRQCLGQGTAFPIKVSPNGRYFVDPRDNPVFWLGTTQWQLCRDYNLDEAKLIQKVEITASPSSK